MRKAGKTELIAGPQGNIEVRFTSSKHPNTENANKLMVLSHPHPLYGGTMNNKVVTTLEKALGSLGFNTLTFNFRGVGLSEGEHDHADGEVNDLLAVTEWGMQCCAAAELHLGGFSFGSFISLKAVAELNPRSLITVAPPVGIYDFSTIQFPEDTEDFKWSMIQGGQDEVVCAQKALEWVRTQGRKPDIYWREQASHFFHGELIWLREAVKLIYL